MLLTFYGDIRWRAGVGNLSRIEAEKEKIQVCLHGAHLLPSWVYPIPISAVTLMSGQEDTEMLVETLKLLVKSRRGEDGGSGSICSGNS